MTMISRMGRLAAGWLLRCPLGAMATAGMLSAAAARGESIDLNEIPAGTIPGLAIEGWSHGELAGLRVSLAGDVNGDGLDDMVVGAPFAYLPGAAAYVVFGRSTGGSVDLGPVAAGIAGGFRITAAQPGYAGWSVSGAGDVNGDGLADLVIGAPGSLDGSGPTPPRVFVVFGKATSTGVDLSAIAAGAGGGFVVEGFAVGSQAGFCVAAAGDLDGDGLADIIAGAPGHNGAAGVDAGACFVVLGRTSTAPVDATALMAGVGGAWREGAAAGERAGAAVSGASDLNGDGVADLVVGAPGWDNGALENAGRAYIVFGGAAAQIAALPDVAAGTGGFVATGSQSGRQAGLAVAGLGDMNGDGLGDVAIGEPGPFGAANDAAPNRCYVVFGKGSTGAVALSAIEAGMGGGFAVVGTNSNDLFGLALSAAGDVDGNGQADVVIGEPLSGAESSGRAALVLGRTGTTPLGLADVINGTIDGFLFADGAPIRYLGYSASGAGDVNGDGLPDIHLGTFFGESEVGFDAGLSYVVFSPYATTPRAPAVEATYSAFMPAGDRGLLGIGAAHLGRDRTAWVDARVWLDEGASAFPSVATATVTRSRAGISGLPATVRASNVAAVRWAISSDRQPAQATAVTVRYTTAEITGLDEDSIELWHAPSLAGPWTPLPVVYRAPARHQLSAQVPALGNDATHFLLVGPIDRERGDTNGDGAINAADVTALGNHLAGIEPLAWGINGDLDNDGAIGPGDIQALVALLVDGTPLPAPVFP